jgi:putative ABC transport system substrate-binding protein
MAQSGDAVRTGVIASLARPGGNITGMTLNSIEQVVRRLQLVRDFSAEWTRVAALCSASPAHRQQLAGMEAAAPTLGIALQPLPNRSPDEVKGSLQAAVDGKAQVIFTMEDPLIEGARQLIVGFAMQRKIPVVGEFRPMVMAGALLSYSPNQVDMWRRAADYVDKILKGAKAADLPVEQPNRFELLINRKTAKQLALEVPARMIALADEVIE